MSEVLDILFGKAPSVKNSSDTSVAQQGALNSILTNTGNNASIAANDLLLKPPSSVTAPTVTPMLIDPSVSSNAFQKGVVDPLTTNFNTNVLPGIAGHYGQSAGGAFSSDALKARQQAGLNFDTTLAQEGAQYTLGAEQLNQAATTAANSTNSGAAVSTNSTNVGANTANNSIIGELIANILRGSTSGTNTAVALPGTQGIVQAFLGGVGGKLI